MKSAQCVLIQLPRLIRVATKRLATRSNEHTDKHRRYVVSRCSSSLYNSRHSVHCFSLMSLTRTSGHRGFPPFAHSKPLVEKKTST
jgi:hypothetical protein